MEIIYVGDENVGNVGYMSYWRTGQRACITRNARNNTSNVGRVESEESEKVKEISGYFLATKGSENWRPCFVASCGVSKISSQLFFGIMQGPVVQTRPEVPYLASGEYGRVCTSGLVPFALCVQLWKHVIVLDLLI